MLVRLELRTEYPETFGRKHARYLATVSDEIGKTILEVDNHAGNFSDGLIEPTEVIAVLERLLAEVRERMGKLEATATLASGSSAPG